MPTHNGHIIVLERVVEDFVPQYSVYGLTSCLRCNHLVYVGHETARVLADDELDARPICMECVIEIDAQTPGGIHGNKVTRVEDGACPNCGGMHSP